MKGDVIWDRLHGLDVYGMWVYRRGVERSTVEYLTQPEQGVFTWVALPEGAMSPPALVQIDGPTFREMRKELVKMETDDQLKSRLEEAHAALEHERGRVDRMVDALMARVTR